jgi:thioredoxin-like negative regulator of GroEL
MPENSDAIQGRFKPGQSGNPAGKPRGARNPALVALDKIGANNAEDVLQAVITKAKEGDMRAAAAILERVWPARKGRPVSLALPNVETAAGASQAVAAVIAALSRGELTPDEAHAVTAVLDAQRRIIETNDLEARIAALEKREK